MKDAWPCPCCGSLGFSEPAGSFEICGTCGWEDDLVQLAFPNLKGGANKSSLADAQKKFLAGGEVPANRDPAWRALGPGDFLLDWGNRAHWKLWEERKDGEPGLYYWKDDFWLRDAALIKKLKNGSTGGRA